MMCRYTYVDEYVTEDLITRKKNPWKFGFAKLGYFMYWSKKNLIIRRSEWA